jgi:RES domain-containing protein
MIVFRLAKSSFASDLSGKGAQLYGGRWNSKGVPMLYTCQSRALCLVEVAVHLPLGLMPRDYRLVSIAIPDNEMIERVLLDQLPGNWKMFPHPHFTQEVGNMFVKKGESLVLEVPSAVVQGEYNYLINPMHPHFEMVRIVENEQFVFDERLF